MYLSPEIGSRMSVMVEDNPSHVVDGNSSPKEMVPVCRVDDVVLTSGLYGLLQLLRGVGL